MDFLGELSRTFWFLIFAVSFVSAGHAILNKRYPRSALVWVILCLIWPVVGALLYWLFGVNRIWRRNRKLEALHSFSELNQETKAVLPESYHYISRISDYVTDQPVLSGHQIEILKNGDLAYPRMLEVIGAARESVFMMSYIFTLGEVGGAFVEAFLQAKQRGVEVKVLIDGVGQYYPFSRIERRLKKEGIQAALFLPPSIFPPNLNINLRNHSKILLIDGEIGFTGGMNICDENLVEKTAVERAIRNLHFEIRGPAVLEMENVFRRNWVLSSEEPILWKRKSDPRQEGSVY